MCVPAKNGKILGKAFPIQMHDLAYLMTEKERTDLRNKLYVRSTDTFPCST